MHIEGTFKGDLFSDEYLDTLKKKIYLLSEDEHSYMIMSQQCKIMSRKVIYSEEYMDGVSVKLVDEKAVKNGDFYLYSRYRDIYCVCRYEIDDNNYVIRRKKCDYNSVNNIDLNTVNFSVYHLEYKYIPFVDSTNISYDDIYDNNPLKAATNKLIDIHDNMVENNVRLKAVNILNKKLNRKYPVLNVKQAVINAVTLQKIDLINGFDINKYTVSVKYDGVSTLVYFDKSTMYIFNKTHVDSVSIDKTLINKFKKYVFESELLVNDGEIPIIYIYDLIPLKTDTLTNTDTNTLTNTETKSLTLTLNYIKRLEIIKELCAILTNMNTPIKYDIRLKPVKILSEVSPEICDKMMEESEIKQDGLILTEIEGRKIYKIKKTITIDLICVKS